MPSGSTSQPSKDRRRVSHVGSRLGTADHPRGSPCSLVFGQPITAEATTPGSWSGSLGAELAEEAAVVGPDELLDEPTLVVEPEDVHEVHDDACPGGRYRAGG